MQIQVVTTVAVPPAFGFSGLLKCAEQIAKIEGKDLFRHVAKMSTAAGDLAATAVENFQPDEHTYDEVAGLVLRAAIFGIAHGMTPNDLAAALGRETERLVRDGVVSKIDKALAESDFGLTDTAMIASGV